MNKADVAVIVPVFNRPSVVLEALDSVVAQSLPPRRLIVVDDGSTDHTMHAVSHWIERLETPLESTLIHQENRGAPSARNRGMAAAGGCRFLAFLDSDDLWPADFLARTYALLMAHPAAVAVTCDQLRLDFNGQPMEVRCTEPLAHDATRWIFLNNGEIGSCSLFRSDAIERAGRYDEDLPTGEDTDLFLRVSLCGPWLHAAGAPVTYRCGVAAHRCEEGQLSRKYANGYSRWAMIRENFIQFHGGRDVMPPAFFRRPLAQRWYQAGRELLAHDQNMEARKCLRRALQWRPWYPKAWLRLAETFLRRDAWTEKPLTSNRADTEEKREFPVSV